MLGPAKSRCLDQPIAVSVEALVPLNNCSRHLDATLDLAFVRDWARELYAERGRPSIDPVVFFKFQLIMFSEGIRSERKLVEIAALHLAHRWYLGYALDENLPDHSSLTRIRQRLGVAIFERFFEQVVDLCQKAGLVWGQELFVDATKVRANADVDSLVPRFYHEAKAHVAELFTDDAAAAEQAAIVDDLPAGIARLPCEPAPGGSPVAADPPWRLLEERRLDPRRAAAGGYQRVSAWRVSPTDPDATPMRTKIGTTLGYHDHCVVDGGKARIILAALVTPADVMENVPMQDLLWRVCFRRKLRPHQVTGDTTYGTVENVVAMEDAGIRAYLPLPDFDARTPFFGKGAFTYHTSPRSPGTGWRGLVTESGVDRSARTWARIAPSIEVRRWWNPPSGQDSSMPPVRRSRQQPTDDWQQLRLLVTSPEQATYELLRPIVLFGQPAADRARETGVPERTLRRTAVRFAEQGMQSLFDDPTPMAERDRRRLPPETRRAIVDLKAEYPPFSLREIARICRRQFGRPVDH